MEQFEPFIEETIFKMIQDGRIFLGKNIDMNTGEISIYLNCVLMDEDDDGKPIRYEANPTGANSIKIK